MHHLELQVEVQGHGSKRGGRGGLGKEQVGTEECEEMGQRGDVGVRTEDILE